MLHEPAVPVEKDHAIAKKTKLGVILFFVYTLIYAGFVVIGLTDPELLGVDVIGGQNLAIVYGFGLILLAIVMGFIYNFFCSRFEDKMNNHTTI